MGDGSSASLGKRRLIDRSIAHNAGAARVRFAPLKDAGAFSPGMEARPTRNLHWPEKEIVRRARQHPDGEPPGAELKSL
jgi:hypothetical protein